MIKFKLPAIKNQKAKGIDEGLLRSSQLQFAQLMSHRQSLPDISKLLLCVVIDNLSRGCERDETSIKKPK